MYQRRACWTHSSQIGSRPKKWREELLLVDWEVGDESGRVWPRASASFAWGLSSGQGHVISAKGVMTASQTRLFSCGSIPLIAI